MQDCGAETTLLEVGGGGSSVVTNTSVFSSRVGAT